MKMKRQRFLIAIDFSEASYRALQFATLLAKELSASLTLIHVIDADKLTESDNPLVLSRSIALHTSKAESRMYSFSEMIACSWLFLDYSSQYFAIFEVDEYAISVLHFR